jgi:hypothetical protein
MCDDRVMSEYCVRVIRLGAAGECLYGGITQDICIR